MELEACGVYPVGTYWLKEEWYNHLYSQPRWQLLGLMATETAELIGSLVYEDGTDTIAIHKITVSEQGHLSVFRAMLQYVQGTLLGARNRVVAYPNKRDSYWLNEFETLGYLNTGSFTLDGEEIDVLQFTKH